MAGEPTAASRSAWPRAPGTERRGGRSLQRGRALPGRTTGQKAAKSGESGENRPKAAMRKLAKPATNGQKAAKTGHNRPKSGQKRPCPNTAITPPSSWPSPPAHRTPKPRRPPEYPAHRAPPRRPPRGTRRSRRNESRRPRPRGRALKVPLSRAARDAVASPSSPAVRRPGWPPA